jgi:hypothetical protein
MPARVRSGRETEVSFGVHDRSTVYRILYLGI